MFILGFFTGCLVATIATAMFIGIVRSGNTEEEGRDER